MTLKEALEKVQAYMDNVYSENMLEEIGDDKFRIYTIMDSVQREIAALALPLRKEEKVSAQEGIINLPEDIMEPVNLKDEEGRFISFITFAPGKIRVKEDGEYTLFYFAYPEKITKDSGDDFELTLDPIGQEAFIFGVCAALYMNTEPKLYADFSDRYTAYLNNIISKNTSMPSLKVMGGEML